MNIKQNFSIKFFNTFGIDVKAKYFVELNSDEEIISFLSSGFLKNKQFLILGGGSNILFTKDFTGVVVKINSKGITILKEDEDFIYVKAMAGEVWQDFIDYNIKNNYGGLENLSKIPGSVGAGPIQNIGAYGVELKDVFYQLTAINIQTGDIIKFNKKDCNFGYRSSIFKNELKNKYIINSVVFRLFRKPVFNTKYGAIEMELRDMGINKLSVSAVSEAVSRIRKRKLPDIEQIGCAGSFFKNPVITEEEFKNLKKDFPNIITYERPDKTFKIAAGWLIEQCGWKGKRIGNAGVYKNQALVLVNYGNSTGKEILELSCKIENSVFEKFNIRLNKEVNVF